jgi:trimeric autotransporter adhesin
MITNQIAPERAPRIDSSNAASRKGFARSSRKSRWILAIACGFALASQLRAQSTAFTYQGRLTIGGIPAHGIYDLRFILFNASDAQVGSIFTNDVTVISNGLFTVQLDFGAGVFDGSERWLEINVRTNGAGAFSTLSPRQPITHAPYAVFADNVNAAGILGNIPASQVSGVLAESQMPANVARLVPLNTAQPATGTVTVTSGFVTSANLTFGGSGYTSVPAVTINAAAGSGAVITATVSNGIVRALTVQNAGSGYSPDATLTIAGPPNNAQQTFAGRNNFTGTNIFTNPANVFSGNGAGLTDVDAVALDGLPAGQFWQLGGNAVAPGQFLGSTNEQALDFRVNGDRALRLEPIISPVPSVVNVIGGSAANFAATDILGATIAGGGAGLYADVGYSNKVLGNFGTIGGGLANTINSNAGTATIAGGFRNLADGSLSAIAGGGENASLASYSSVGGGTQNTNAGYSSAIVGGYQNVINGGGYGTIGGGQSNTNGGTWSTIGGGRQNLTTNLYSTVAGGSYNTAGGYNSSVVGGTGNVAGGDHSAVPGGVGNVAQGRSSFAAGVNAHAVHDNTFVWNSGFDYFSGGPAQFCINAIGGVVLSEQTGLFFGSRKRQMTHAYGSVYGMGVQDFTHYFRTDAVGSYAWYAGGAHSDTQYDPGSGGKALMFLNNGGNLTIRGVLIQNSDRNVKENFEAVDTREILEKLADLSLTKWNYKEDPGSTHLGPMAQDFHAAFGLGDSDKHIAALDADGVALAAIQGLNQKLDEELKSRDAENAALKREVDNLRTLVNSLAQNSTISNANNGD